jgi:hypothetical protein
VNPVATDTAQALAPHFLTRTRTGEGVVSDRYEYKYTIRASLMDQIRSFILPYCEMDRFAAREPEKFYTITSLYLDTDGYKTYWDKQSDAPSRFKLRVRTYGELSRGPVKFEIKRFLNEITRKTSVNVPQGTWTGLLTAPASDLAWDLSRAERSGIEDFIRLTRTYGARPKMLVQYQRQVFTIRNDPSVRISFDRSLRYQPATTYDLAGGPGNWRAGGESRPFGVPGTQVLFELKFASRIPSWIVALVRAFGLSRQGYSKYCSAVERTLYAGRIAGELAQAVPVATVLKRP